MKLDKLLLRECFPEVSYDKMHEYRITASSISTSSKMRATTLRDKQRMTEKPIFTLLMISQVNSLVKFKYFLDCREDLTKKINAVVCLFVCLRLKKHFLSFSAIMSIVEKHGSGSDRKG